MASKLHVRSNSLPNGSHPCSSRVRDQLNNLKAFEATWTSESIVTSLSFLEDVYSCLDDLVNVASTQKVLDICGITRDTAMQIKENVQFLHSALRRRKVDSTIETSIAELQLVDATLNIL
ncbi:hypothetical protein HN51_024656 [Arachis hypogaea]|uniref:Uncharacterized protein n=1 Tax=Arachis hypogaea TaxID=3818 RepID=A0A445C7I2_ARAHY|nr:uncharacterized protein DS421_7g210350 [Arachis hypogaea]RYR46906.1 hypothetical protein Ahy_A07g032770 [Arachis hypogaea]